MKVLRTEAALGLGLVLSAPIYARQTTDQSNEAARKATKAELRQHEKADKAQAKADKSERKAAGSHKVKKAVRDQDKANAVQPQ